MGLHHATLKAAVLVYAALIGTMTEDSLKLEIGKDEKGFTSEEVEEIYAAAVKSHGDTSTLTGTENQLAAVVVDTPNWVAELLASNLAVQESNTALIASNQAVLDTIATFEETAGVLVEQIEFASQHDITTTGQNHSAVLESKSFNPAYDYEVAAGKEFRAPNDFTLIHKEGENVNHLGGDKLASLLTQGLVVEVDPED